MSNETESSSLKKFLLFYTYFNRTNADLEKSYNSIPTFTKKTYEDDDFQELPSSEFLSNVVLILACISCFGQYFSKINKF